MTILSPMVIESLFPKRLADPYGSMTILVSMLPWNLFGPGSYGGLEILGLTSVLPHLSLPSPSHRSTSVTPDELRQAALAGR